jgi:hypothetical protein
MGVQRRVHDRLQNTGQGRIGVLVAGDLVRDEVLARLGSLTRLVCRQVVDVRAQAGKRHEAEPKGPV